MDLLLLAHVFQCGLLVVHSCPALCSCAYGSYGTPGLRSVVCNHPNISAVPPDAPAGTVKLRLEKTSLSRVPRAAFRRLSELRFLWLTYNSITALHPGSLLNLRALRELRLDGNLLSAFPWEGLRATPRLRTLGLHNNRLASLPARAAAFLPNVTFLDLSSNRLTRLPAELLDMWFPVVEWQGGAVRRVLGLHDNPWLCDCQVSMVASLSASPGSPVVLMDRLLTCAGSVGRSGGVSPATRADPSRCARPSVRPGATAVTSSLGSDVFLRCDATGYPTPTLSWVKTSVYTQCCRPAELPADPPQLPRRLESFMQESPRLGVRWSILSLSGLSYQDAGEYRCRARNTAGSAEAPVLLSVVGVMRGLLSSKRTSLKTPSRSSSSSDDTEQILSPKSDVLTGTPTLTGTPRLTGTPTLTAVSPVPRNSSRSPVDEPSSTSTYKKKRKLKSLKKKTQTSQQNHT